MRRLHRALFAAPFILLACHDDQRTTHVYGSPPSPLAPAAATAASPTVPELPIGTRGPGARLVAVYDAATGAPVALGSIADSVDVLTLVAFGPGALSRDGGRVELVVRSGSADTTLAVSLLAPAPNVVAHAFRVAGLKIGRYTSTVRLRTRAGRVIAESVPLFLEVVGR